MALTIPGFSTNKWVIPMYIVADYKGKVMFSLACIHPFTWWRVGFLWFQVPSWGRVSGEGIQREGYPEGDRVSRRGRFPGVIPYPPPQRRELPRSVCILLEICKYEIHP